MRQRLTFKHLLRRCAHLSNECMRRPGKLRPVMSISFDEFNDLKGDMDFIQSFNWAGMDATPKEFNCNGIRCTIEGRDK